MLSVKEYLLLRKALNKSQLHEHMKFRQKVVINQCEGNWTDRVTIMTKGTDDIFK